MNKWIDKINEILAACQKEKEKEKLMSTGDPFAEVDCAMLDKKCQLEGLSASGKALEMCLKAATRIKQQCPVPSIGCHSTAFRRRKSCERKTLSGAL